MQFTGALRKARQGKKGNVEYQCRHRPAMFPKNRVIPCNHLWAGVVNCSARLESVCLLLALVTTVHQSSLKHQMHKLTPGRRADTARVFVLVCVCVSVLWCPCPELNSSIIAVNQSSQNTQTNTKAMSLNMSFCKTKAFWKVCVCVCVCVSVCVCVCLNSTKTQESE